MLRLKTTTKVGAGMKKRIYTVLLAAALLLCGCAAVQMPTTTAQPTTTVFSPATMVQPTTVLPTTVPVTTLPPTTVPPTTLPPLTVPPTTVPPVTTVPTPSVLSFLKIALQPVGNTMYVWGGGWNEEDTGAGEETTTLGVSPQWANFAAQQDSSYDMNNTRYQIHDGLDCSGYVGWAVYNLLETENGRPGYVMPSTQMALGLSQMGLGEYIPVGQLQDFRSGDIVSMEGHVWIVLGTCEDSSVLFVHASPPGVMISGTVNPDESESQASQLARELMQQYYPEWYVRYPDCARSHRFLTESGAMRWHPEKLSDPEGVFQMTAHQIAELLFP